MTEPSEEFIKEWIDDRIALRDIDWPIGASLRDVRDYMRGQFWKQHYAEVERLRQWREFGAGRIESDCDVENFMLEG